MAFAHLDLGIGGAERLMVNLSLALHQEHHSVEMYTTHHSQEHCFEETKRGRVLGDRVHCYGDWLPRQILGRCTALCSIVRMLYLTVVLIALYWLGSFDAVVLDGVSAPLILLRIFNVPTLFYCHYPDKLLCTDRTALAKRVYRSFIDALEDISMVWAHKVVCNSSFTRGKVRDSFWILSRVASVEVLYPPVEDIAASQVVEAHATALAYTGGQPFFVSLNRYERKKDVGLVIRALRHLQSTGTGRLKTGHVKVVIAGGYDDNVAENVEYRKELEEEAFAAGVSDEVVFRTSVSDSERAALLTQAQALLYTPQNEHFGIVPLEAMLLGTPVIAVNSGGPLETVMHGKTGYLSEPTGEGFATCMRSLVDNPRRGDAMGKGGRAHVQKNFLLDSCSVRLTLLLNAVKKSRDAECLSVLSCHVLAWSLMSSFCWYGLGMLWP